ncbi:Por secretion system C-terminal sorting domain-containing protein [Mesonia phycicola]|uniref:Por secretion system C-terminal sorting domain-containing protein n=1 Tax=Mesonia phycicola TaxID=579105 RepID=A0A1M6G8V3_9FLAO|nr:T9SS type A sorting domain-containing protein [Mesonia phycicola]SHJ06359.1 Por secretion system C-terminal sorting domain-containing protein [Mesonia phycicola]
MNKNHLFLSIVLLLFFFGISTVNAQVLVYEDFEGGSSLSDFTSWSSGLPPFDITNTNACSGSQSLSVSSTGGTRVLSYGSQVTTGQNIEVSFQYKVVSPLTGNPVAANSVSIDLQYSADSGTTWTTYTTLTGATLDCSTQTDVISSTNLPAGSNFAWQMVVNHTGTDVNVYVDRFTAVEQVSCVSPTKVEIDESSVTFDSANISWIDLNNPNATEWEVAYCTFELVPTGSSIPNPSCNNPFQTVTGTVDSNGGMTASLTGLNDGQIYYVYVRSVCGPTDKSEWSAPKSFRTIAIGSYCEVAIEVNQTVGTPNNSIDLPYTNTNQTDVFGSEDYSGAPGGNCGTSLDILDGYEVVYHFTSSQDDILTVSVSNLSASATTGLFIYEDCNDIGGTNGICFDGGSSTNGQDFEVNSLFVTAGQDLYIVLATVDASGAPINSSYTIDIEGFECSTWIAPAGDAVEPFIAGQTLADFSITSAGVNPTIDGATLKWYDNNSGVPGMEVTAPLDSVLLSDQDVYFVTQNIASCESPYLMVTFEEIFCLTDLGGVSNGQADEVCESGELTLSVTKNSSQYDSYTEVYWYDQATGGEPVGVGSTFTTPTLSQTQTYYATEVFVGEGEMTNQGNLGPVASSTSSLNYGVIIDVVQPLTIVSVDVYVAGTDNLELELAGGSTGFVPLTKTIAVNGGTTSNPTLNTITLNWTISSPGTYYLRKTSGPSMYYTASTDATFPYALGTGAEITSGANTTGSSNTGYYYFYNWTIRGPEELCETARVPVDAVVHDVASVTATATDMLVCVGSTADLYASSSDSDYVYTWSWTDVNGAQTLTGANVNPVVVANTTFTVDAYNPITTCSTSTTIDIEANGIDSLGVIPDGDVDICTDEILSLTAGSSIYDFNNGQDGWTLQNSSQTSGLVNVPAADWQIVSSPFSPTGYQLDNIVTDDNSDFFVTIPNKVGSGGSVDNYLISPSFNFVGTASATLSFKYLFKDYGYNLTNNLSYFDVYIRVDQGAWQDLRTSISGDFDALNFEDMSLDLSSYVGSSDVQVAFNINGSWSWWLAIDDVILERKFADGFVTWSPITDLYFDEEATSPYDGSGVNQVYFTQSNAGVYNYTATLDFVSCTDVTSDINITVSFSDLPTAPSLTQLYITGETTGDLDVTGTDLKYYILNDAGEYREVTINYLLSHGETYYVTQTLNNCESDYLAITVELECLAPTNLTMTTANASLDGATASVLIEWDNPADLTSIEDYILKVYDESSMEVYSSTVSSNLDYKVINYLPLNSSLTAEIYSICDSSIPVLSAVSSVDFDTNNLKVGDLVFNTLNYYPNPFKNEIIFENGSVIDVIEIYSINGQKILSKKIGLTETKLSLDNLATGVYFASVYVGKTRKVVKVIKE